VNVNFTDRSQAAEQWARDTLGGLSAAQQQQQGTDPPAAALDEALVAKALADGSAGRVGESVALTYLRSQPGVAEVRWENEEAEAGRPYDLRLSYADGRNKYCEVKTRFVVHPHCANQWFISPKELHFAYEQGEAYFVLLICIAVDRTTHETCPPQMALLGLERGFVQAALTEEVSILVQLNRKGTTEL
jgi:hypothetical protein